MMHGKVISEHGIGEVAKDFRDNATRGVYCTPYEPLAERGQLVDACWGMAIILNPS